MTKKKRANFDGLVKGKKKTGKEKKVRDKKWTNLLLKNHR